MKVLQLNSSIRAKDSISNQFANKISQKLNQKYDAHIILRDLELNPVTPLNTESVNALFSGNLEHPTMIEHTDLINEIKLVDTLVIGVPMYNFTIPSTLKNYFDAITRAHTTFRYTEEGPVGLLPINEAFIVFARGGLYNKRLTFQEDFIDTMLTFLGVKKIHHLFIEGLNMGEQSAKKSLEEANFVIENI
jgi:FMN-dependent NADH-azoreductase